MTLRFGMLGGGNGGFIGNVHRQGASMDDLAVLSAGCFTRDEEKNLETGRRWHITDESRIYKNYSEMARAESSRSDGIDFVCITTPNASHYEIAKCFMEHGIHIMCDKPLALNLEQSLELQAISKERGLLFGLTYTYTGYAAIRQAREMIRKGEIGEILHVVAEYPQDWVISSLVQEKSDQAAWRFNPATTGESLCTGDIGTHLEQLIAQATGLELKRVLARFDTYPRDLPLETNTTILLDYGNAVTGTMWASQIAIGFECELRLRVFGSKGSLEWRHASPGSLYFTRINEPTQKYSVNREYMTEECNRLCRLPAGHPEGYFEAFGNIYRSFCETLLARLSDSTPDSFTYPTIDDGVKGMQFVHACVKSHQSGNTWVDVI
ncbi:MAG: Gfo/Idh/MocA family protein [Lachnospiraceae bacterium]